MLETEKAEIFEAKFCDEKFVTNLSNGNEVEVCSGGSQKKVTVENRREFVELAVKARQEEARKQLNWLMEGFNYIVPVQTFMMLTWQDLETRCVGD